MPWNNEIPPLLEPPSVEDPNLDKIETGDEQIDDALWSLYDQLRANADRTGKGIQAVLDFGRQLASAFERYGSSLNRVVNGGIEFPTPYATEHTGNIKMSYVPLYLRNRADTSAVRIAHRYGDGVGGQTPRGWFLLANSTANSSGSGRLLDQILSSDSSAPWDSGNFFDTATVTNSTKISGGTATGTDGWSKNGVVAGDQIRLLDASAGYTMTGTVAISTSGAVTGTGTSFTTEYAVGWFIRVSTGSDNGYHRVLSIESDTAMTVDPYLTAVAAGAGHGRLAADGGWLNIVSVTPGGAPEYLTLDPNTPTAIPSGTSCEYVIRRPMDETYAWVRFLGSGTLEATLAFF